VSLLLEEGEVRDHVEPEAAARMAAPVSLPVCDRCGERVTDVRTLLDSRKGRSIRMMMCRCGQQSWAEDK
jgi:hypothetical protein